MLPFKLQRAEPFGTLKPHYPRASAVGEIREISGSSPSLSFSEIWARLAMQKEYGVEHFYSKCPVRSKLSGVGLSGL